MKITKSLLAALMLPMVGLVACSDNATEVNSGSPELDENGMATVAINVFTDAASTRATDAASIYNISAADMIDVLVFEVYEVTTENNEKTYSLLPYYKNVDSDFTSMTLGEGQSAVNFSKAGKTLVLKVNPEKDYAIAFWAQNSKTTAYNVKDGGLQKLTVNYDGYKNNDESRDAFSGSLEFSGSDRKILETTLYRPFAQINVGTTGADYVTSSKALGGTYYAYSKVEITGVANTFNVLTDKIGDVVKDGANNKTVVFDWAPLAAWINESGIPSDKTSAADELAPVVKTENEQFLLIDLNGDKEFKPFLTAYSTIEEKDGKTEYLTETFKYLSMSYILVPTTLSTSESESASPNKGSLLDKFKISFANANSIDGDPTTDNAAITGFTLNNVPVNRNWRTNILGGFYQLPTKPDPDDPDNPDPEDPDPGIPYDPSSVFSAVGVKVTLVSTYFGDNTPITDINQFNGTSNSAGE